MARQNNETVDGNFISAATKKRKRVEKVYDKPVRKTKLKAL